MSSSVQIRGPRAFTSKPARFHLSLNVGNLSRTVDFFKVFFGVEATKCRSDYAKFELEDPPLVLSLEPSSAPGGGNLNHLGFRVASSAALVEVQHRLELAGISTRREEGVECCYAKQTKFWVHDPDGNLWEVYVLEEDIDHRGDGRLPSPASEEPTAGPAQSIWNHRLGQPFPNRLPILDGTVDVANLQGTLNERLAEEEQLRRLREICRIVKPGGRVHLHMLTADRPIASDEPIALPGPAAAVKAVPAEDELLVLLTAAGFTSARFVFRAATPCFHVGAAELRESRVEADASASSMR